MKSIEKEFSQGVKILLERMQNNPEDFVTSYHSDDEPKFGMFADLMRDIVRGDKVKWDDWHLFTKAEQTALIEGFKEMMRARFDQGIMSKLLEEPKYEDFSKKEYYGKPLTINQITNESLRLLEKQFANPKPTTFTLNSSQLKLAQKLGLSPEDYARETGMIP
jgi:hypothetical protein